MRQVRPLSTYYDCMMTWHPPGAGQSASDTLLDHRRRCRHSCASPDRGWSLDRSRVWWLISISRCLERDLMVETRANSVPARELVVMSMANQLRGLVRLEPGASEPSDIIVSDRSSQVDLPPHEEKGVAKPYF